MMRELAAFTLGVIFAMTLCWAAKLWDYRHDLALAEKRIAHQKILLADTHRFWLHRLEHERRHFAPICVDVRTMSTPEMLWHIEDVFRRLNLEGKTKLGGENGQ